MKLDVAELFDLRMRRQDKPPTNAKEAKYYGDPQRFTEFESELKRLDDERKKRRDVAKLKGSLCKEKK